MRERKIAKENDAMRGRRIANESANERKRERATHVAEQASSRDTSTR